MANSMPGAMRSVPWNFHRMDKIEKLIHRNDGAEVMDGDKHESFDLMIEVG